MVLTARDMVDKGRAGSREEIREGLGGNLCRCGCYVKIIEAIEEAATVKFVTYPKPTTAPRVGYLDGEDVVDAGFDGDMVAFIEAGAPHRHGHSGTVAVHVGCSRRCARAPSATSSPSRAT